MTEVSIKALDGARLVRVEDNGYQSVLQAWYGGTQVRVFTAYGSELHEVSVWNMSDDEGRPVEREKIDEHMQLHFAAMDEEGGL